MNMIAVPRLETERLILRSFTQKDFAAFTDFYAHESTAKFVGGIQEPWQVWRRMASYIGHWQLRGYGFFALEDKQGGQFVGYCGPWYPEGWPEPEIGWGLLSYFQGRGLAMEAARRCLEFAYKTLGWKTAISVIDADNHASKRVAERLGAHFEKHQQILHINADIYRHIPATDFKIE